VENLDTLITKLYPRIFRRLSRSSYFPTIHVLLFTLAASFFGFSIYQQIADPNQVRSVFGTIGYWQVMLWSVIQFSHIGIVYWNSGARYGKRETVVKEEVLDIAKEYSLNKDEMIELHERLSQLVHYRSQQFQKLWTLSKSLFLLWLGTFVVGAISPESYSVGPTMFSIRIYFDALFIFSWSLSIIFSVAFMPIQRLFRKTETYKLHNYNNLDYTQAQGLSKTNLL
jgi:hypothetical protein